MIWPPSLRSGEIKFISRADLAETILGMLQNRRTICCCILDDRKNITAFITFRQMLQGKNSA